MKRIIGLPWDDVILAAGVAYGICSPAPIILGIKYHSELLFWFGIFCLVGGFVATIISRRSIAKREGWGLQQELFDASIARKDGK